jgi:DNA invertase Pin-like site-specific DNA recombinase
MTQKATGLIRVSTAHQADSGLGLAAQEASIREWCSANDVELVALHTEAGVSGRVELDKRAGLVEAIADARNNDSKFFIVAKMDRLSRDPLVSLTVEKTLFRSNIQVVSTSGEGTENNDASSVLMRRIMSAVAECEATMISARTSASIQARLAAGGRWGRAPLGFKVVDGELVATELAAIILEAVGMSESGVRQRPIMAFLTLQAPEITWSQPKVSRILKQWKNDENLRTILGA